MRIRELGATLHLMRYAGYDSDKKKGVESKIGAVGKYCLPVVLDKDLPVGSNEGIPASLWRKLTIEEQEKLMAHLQEIQVGMTQTRARLTVDGVNTITALAADLSPESAQSLWEATEALQRALKKAGHAKPAKKAKPAQNADIHTASLLPIEG